MSSSFVLSMRTVSDRFVEKMKTHLLYSRTSFSGKLSRLWDVEKYGRGRQATDSNIIQRMRIACWMTKATDTHSEYVVLIFFHGSCGYANAPECCVIRTVPDLLYVKARWYVELPPCWFARRKGAKYMRTRTEFADRDVDAITNVLSTPPPPPGFLGSNIDCVLLARKQIYLNFCCSVDTVHVVCILTLRTCVRSLPRVPR